MPCFADKCLEGKGAGTPSCRYLQRDPLGDCLESLGVLVVIQRAACMDRRSDFSSHVNSVDAKAVERHVSRIHERKATAHRIPTERATRRLHPPRRQRIPNAQRATPAISGREISKHNTPVPPMSPRQVRGLTRVIPGAAVARQPPAVGHRCLRRRGGSGPRFEPGDQSGNTGGLARRSGCVLLSASHLICLAVE